MTMFERLLSNFSKGFAVTCRVALVGILVLMNVEVIARYIFHVSTKISDEYSGYMFTWMVMFGLLEAHRSGSMFQVRALLDVTSGVIRHVLYILNGVLGLLLCCIAGYGAFRMTMVSFQFQTTSTFISRTLIYIPQALIPIGYGLLAISFLDTIIRAMAGRPPVEDKVETDEALPT